MQCSRTPGAAATALTLAVALLCAACVDLEPRPDPTRWYVLEPPGPRAGAPEPDAIPVWVEHVEIAPHLESGGLAIREGPHEIAYLEHDRWAEPLADGVARTLAGAIDAVPGLAGTTRGERAPDLVLEVVVRRLEAVRVEGGEALVELDWTLRRSDRAEPFRGVHRASRPWPSGEPAELVSALSEALAAVAPEVAEAVAAP